MSIVRSVLLFSEGGAGKSFVMATAQTPMLVVDTEGRYNLLPDQSRVQMWSPEQPFPKVNDDTITVVQINKLAEFEKVLHAVSQPEAPWKTIGVDSVTVLVKIGENEIVNATARDSRQEYKKLFNRLEPYVIQLKYLAGRADLQLDTVIFTAWQDSEKPQPFMTGSIKASLNHLFDLIGQVTITVVDGKLGNVLHIMPTQGIKAKAPGDWYEKYKERIINPNIKALNEENK